MSHKIEVKSVAEEYAQRIWGKKDLVAIDELLDPQIVIHSLLGDFQGKACMKKVVQEWLEGFPDLMVRNIATLSNHELAVIHWRAEGTHRGEFKRIPATGKPIAYSGVSIYRVQNRKIAEYWGYLDMQHLLQQIRG